ncbi:MAG: hypothetical protein OER97_03960 [Gammaproteobacteria bacterium]|nr:hypothetical protein [Gammaproteobacteria bacterium]
MLDLFLSIIDRLIQLKGFRDARAAKRFQEIYQPSFEELLLVHRDYVGMFTPLSKLDQMHDSSRRMSWEETQVVGKAVVTALEYVRERRVEFEPVRGKLRALVELLNELDLATAEAKFIRAVLDYLSPVTRLEKDESLQIDLGHLGKSVSTRVVLELELLAELFSLEHAAPSALIHPLISEYERGHLSISEDRLAELITQEVAGFIGGVEWHVKHLRIHWSVVCETYAALRFSSSPHI